MFNLALQTDAYHMTMGFLIRDPMEIESHVLYARSGGPQVVSNLSQLLRRLVSSVPTREQVAEAERFWREQRIPFPAEAWYSVARMDRLPISVRGVIDGEVVLPGDPIAVITGPAALVGAIESIVIGDQMSAIQLGTRFIKTAAAVNWATDRLFEVGLRAVNGPKDHINKIAGLARLGLKFTSHGAAAQSLGLKAVGTMGHRFTQRYTGVNADYQAFNDAIDRMLAYHRQENIQDTLPLSFLVDTRSTLEKGIPAAIRIINDRWDDIVGALKISVRLDSGDMRTQLRVIIENFQRIFAGKGYMPGIIIESGLTPEDIADYERIAAEMDFDSSLITYGVGGYLVGGVNRDWISLVYKVTSFGGDSIVNLKDRTPTMKFGDEPDSGKESYPGNFDLWEECIDGQVVRTLALIDEADKYAARNARNLFVDLVSNGSIQSAALCTDADVQSLARERWSSITNNYLADEKRYIGSSGAVIHRPQFSRGVKKLVSELRDIQFAANQ